MRWSLVLALPFAAAGLQWLLWDPWIKPSAWFLFYPTAFAGALLMGLRGGLVSGALCAVLGWILFIPPTFGFGMNNPSAVVSVAMYLAMAGIFGWTFNHHIQRQVRIAEGPGTAEASRRRSQELGADLDQVQRMLRREIGTYSMKKRYVRKDGRIVWINLTVALVWNKAGPARKS